MPATSSVRKRFQFTLRERVRPAPDGPHAVGRRPDYWTVRYLPLTILNTWNAAPLTSPFFVNVSGWPRIVLGRNVFARAARSEARVTGPFLHADIAACAYAWAAT